MGNGIPGLWAFLLRFFGRDIWVEDFSSRSGLFQRLLTISRLAYMVAHGFWSDNCHLRAAALSYVTILSIAPMLAVAFSISKGLGFFDSAYVHELLMGLTAQRPEVVRSILEYIEATNVRTLGAAGMLTLLLLVMSMATAVERAFNVIWRVELDRSPWRRFTDYFSVMLVTPLLAFMAISFTVSLQHGPMARWLLSIQAVDFVYGLLLKATPYALIWMAFLFMYMFMPNTRVRFFCALPAAVLAGSLWQVAQWYYIRTYVANADTNAVYSSFAQLPLFLVWMYLSWVVVLLGAELSHALQHMRSFAGRIRAVHANQLGRLRGAILLLLALIGRFRSGRGPMAEEELRAELAMPARLTNALTDQLIRAGLVLRTESGAMALAVDPAGILVMDVAEILFSDEVGAAMPLEFAAVDETLEALNQTARRSPANVDLLSLHQRLQDVSAESGDNQHS